MKTKLFLLHLGAMLLLFSCQKEALTLATNPEQAIPSIQLEFVDIMLPENVEVLPFQDEMLIGEIPIFFPDTTITLTNCEQQQCYRIIPNYLNQMQRTANLFCQPMNIAICCCVKGYERCFRFIVHPQFHCAELEEKIELLPKREVLSSNR